MNVGRRSHARARNAAMLLAMALPVASLGGPELLRPKIVVGQDPANDEARIARRKKLSERTRLVIAATKARDAGKLDEAIALGKQSLSIEREVFGDGHADVLNSIQWLAAMAEEDADWPAAKTFRAEAAEWTAKHFGAEDWRTIDARIALATASLSADDRAELRRAAVLNAESIRLFNAGRYAEAAAKAEEVGTIRKRVLGARHPDYATSLQNLALCFLHLGENARAEPLYVEARGVLKSTLGENHPVYAICLNNLAILYDDRGELARAEPLHLEARDIRKRVLGADHPEYARSLQNLGALYRSMGDYARAVPPLVEACDILKRALGEDHSDYAMGVHNLAVLYKITGDYARAEPLHIQAGAVLKRTLGENHPSYATSVQGLANLYQNMGDYERAVPLCAEACRIRRRVLGENHPDYATSLHNLGVLYRNVGEYARAEPLLIEATAVLKRSMGEHHPDYAASVKSLANLYHAVGDYARAEPLYIEARGIFESALADNGLSYAGTLNDLAFLYQCLGDDARAAPLFRRAVEITGSSIAGSSTIQSERQQLAMAQSLRWYLDNYVSLALDSGRYGEAAFGEVLAAKGATLMRQRAMRLIADDPAAAVALEALREAATQAATWQRRTPPAEPQANAAWKRRCVELRDAVERCEADLSGRSAAFRAATEQVRYDALIAALPADAVLVDYLEIRRLLPPKKPGESTTSERRLVAFVVRPSAEGAAERVRLFDLGEAAPLAQLIDEWRSTLRGGTIETDHGARLRAAIWEPLAEAIGDAPTVLLSTDGALGKLPFAALPGKKPGTYLLEDHRLAMVPVPQLIPSLVGDERSRSAVNELLLIGDVDYGQADAEPDAALLAAIDAEAAQFASLRGGAYAPAGGRRWKELENAGGEIAAIRTAFDAQFDLRPHDPLSLTRAAASEGAFRLLAPRFRHLHLATHGFFADPKFQAAAAGDAATTGRTQGIESAEANFQGYDPYLLSGLVLAGANQKATGESDDGILTAREIGVMDLSGVETVVLSACETGLGAEAGGEGLLGVQRAFQVAGARTTIASFWKVDDLVTRRLMERFYANLWGKKKMSRLDAFRDAQIYVLNNPEVRDPKFDPNAADSGPKPTTRTSPYYWAAFTLSGDWR